MKKRVRGMGHGRKTRRSLSQGGTGAAGELNAALGRWPRVKITPMFGRWGYFVGRELFACFPLRPKDHDLWIRLTLEDQRRALGVPGMVPHRRFAARGWVECRVETPREIGRAIGWLRRSYDSLARATERQERRGSD
ncbi:MAG TPA: luciferase family protein [Candidatus Limnocylindrales bacterium]|nr:luciferase family protein [Candidatus Limnocylindrales bacterium]